MSWRSLALAAGMTVFGCQAGFAASIDFEGTTFGCFGTGCSPGSVTATEGGLTFTGVDPFVASIDPYSADFETINLAAFAVDRSIAYNYAGTPFTLRVLFALPSTYDAGLFPADITGTVNGNGNGTITVHFDDAPFLFTFADADGSGAFELIIINDPQLQRNGSSADVLGRLQNVSYTANMSLPVSTVVPEPTTVCLVGAGLIVALCGARRRRRS